MQSLIKPSRLAKVDGSLPIDECCAVDFVSVVVPLFNEQDGLSQLRERLIEFQSTAGETVSCEFLLIDDGSTDNTALQVSELFADHEGVRTITHAENMGVAAAIRTGLLHAESDCVVSIDSDGSYDLDLVTQMLTRFTADVDVIVASPYHPRGCVENVSAWRIALSKCASRIYRAVMTTKLHCYTSCFRIYRRSRCTDLEIRDPGFVGVAELLWAADRSGLRIIEHPAILRPRTMGHSKMKVFRAMLGHLKLIGRIARCRVFRRA